MARSHCRCFIPRSNHIDGGGHEVLLQGPQTSTRYKDPDSTAPGRSARNSFQLGKACEVAFSTTAGSELHQCIAHQFTRVEINHHEERICWHCSGPRASWR